MLSHSLSTVNQSQVRTIIMVECKVGGIETGVIGEQPQ